MTVRELLGMSVDVDVYDDVTEELAIAFCGPMELTEEGLKKFGEALDYPVTFEGRTNVYAIVSVDDPDEKVWKKKLRKARELFEGMAGYCAADDFDKWFRDL